MKLWNYYSQLNIIKSTRSLNIENEANLQTVIFIPFLSLGLNNSTGISFRHTIKQHIWHVPHIVLSTENKAIINTADRFTSLRHDTRIVNNTNEHCIVDCRIENTDIRFFYLSILSPVLTLRAALQQSHGIMDIVVQYWNEHK